MGSITFLGWYWYYHRACLRDYFTCVEFYFILTLMWELVSPIYFNEIYNISLIFLGGNLSKTLLGFPPLSWLLQLTWLYIFSWCILDNWANDLLIAPMWVVQGICMSHFPFMYKMGVHTLAFYSWCEVMFISFIWMIFLKLFKCRITMRDGEPFTANILGPACIYHDNRWPCP